MNTQSLLYPAPMLYPSAEPMDSVTDFATLLSQFAPISLAEMDAVALMDRTDTKYVLHTSQLLTALRSLRHEYRVLTITETRIHAYRTLYFDTTGFEMYLRHHAGRQQRFKVRSRQYVESQRSFLEVKVKSNKDRTNKQRIETGALVTQLTPEASHFVGAHVPLTHTLEPKLWNSFSRITLVSKHATERLTLDLDLAFDNGAHLIRLPGVAIAEVKQDGINRHSAFMQQMRAMAVRDGGFSKYCVGAALLYPAIKHNNFKDKLLLVEKLTGGPAHVYGTH
ncbi:MAG: polyphosphate polymerase domain-containing protein [Caldilineales bacterium]